MPMTKHLMCCKVNFFGHSSIAFEIQRDCKLSLGTSITMKITPKKKEMRKI
jgi:hypothetical protein